MAEVNDAVLEQVSPPAGGPNHSEFPCRTGAGFCGATTVASGGETGGEDGSPIVTSVEAPGRASIRANVSNAGPTPCGRSWSSAEFRWFIRQLHEKPIASTPRRGAVLGERQDLAQP